MNKIVKHKRSTQPLGDFFLSPSTQIYTNLCAALITDDFSVDLAGLVGRRITASSHTQTHSYTRVSARASTLMYIAHAIGAVESHGGAVKREKKEKKITWREVSTIIN